MFVTINLSYANAQNLSLGSNKVLNNENSGWTAANLNMHAKPIINKLRAPNTDNVVAERAKVESDLKSGVSSDATRSGIRAYGAFGIPYTSTRVQAGVSTQTSSSGPNYLSTTYPYRTIGKLFINGGYCSASLIARSVIVTAAHCIQDFGGGSSTYGGWTFVPGNYGAAGATTVQFQPYGSWKWLKVVWPTTWSNGTDTGSGAARNNDLAVIILAKNSKGQFIGDVVGWMKYATNNYSFISSPKTGNMATAATSTLGYPFLMDGGAIMQRVDGPSYLTTIGGALQIWQGSNFTGGSSGGPWVVNFVTNNAVLNWGAKLGTAPVRAVVGVTSWGSDDPNVIKDNYSSRFGQNPQYPLPAYGIYGAGNIGSLMNTACSSLITPLAVSNTYRNAGYCNL